MQTLTRHRQKTPRPALLSFTSEGEALLFLRWARRRIPGLVCDLDEARSSRIGTVVTLATSQKTANEDLWDLWVRGGREQQEEIEAAAGDGGWE